MTSDCNLRDSVSESQNFVLRLTDDFIVDGACGLAANDKDDIIVISDSSCSTSPVRCDTRNWRSTSASKMRNKDKMKYRKLQIIGTSSSETEEDKLDRGVRGKAITADDRSLGKKRVDKKSVQGNKAFYTSDETTNSSNSSYGKDIRYKISKSDIKKTYASPKLIQKLTERDTYVNRDCDMYNVEQTNKVTTPSKTPRSVKSSASSVASRLNKFTVHNTPQQNRTKGIRLTRADAYKILKNIKSTKIVYDSPRETKQVNVIINESTDREESFIHPAMSPKRDRVNYNKNSDINETDPKDNTIPNSQTDVSPERCVSKFPDTPQEDFHRPLSTSKKVQIAEWLMTNRPDSPSDSSCSNIPSSVRNSITNSGNSSLERLEQNYETPNNRGKIGKVRDNEKQTVDLNCDKRTQSGTTYKTARDKLTQMPGNVDIECHTSDSTYLGPKCFIGKKITSPVVDTPKVDFKKCADVLVKLYGESWRDKADILLQTTEPRKKVVQTTNRPIQTERKPVKTKNYTTDSNSVKYDTESGKMTQRKYKKQDSFINDESLSSNNSESIYHTALTNCITSTDSTVSKSVPASAPVRRFLTICDTDTEDELDYKFSSDSRKKLHGKKLSFSDEENSDTSEFDPGDYVPPKNILKKAIKTSQISKATHKYQPSKTTKFVGHRSFLSSLPNTVPINEAHPNAKKYKLDYKNMKEELCKELYKLYNEKVFDNKLPPDMLIEWNVRMRGTAGYCYNKKCIKTLTITKTSRIVLATKIIDTPDRLRDTLIHEMCHAAAWQINGVSDGHGPFWKGWANKAMKMFPELPPIRRCHDYEIKTKFTYRCIDCGYSIGRHSKSLDIEKKRCGHCYGKFELLINKATKSGTVQMQTPRREPSGFALYVKQNYSSVKKGKTNMKHADVMKTLGQQFSALKITKKNDLAVENDPGMSG